MTEYINTRTFELMSGAIPKGIGWIEVPHGANVMTKDRGGAFYFWNTLAGTTHYNGRWCICDNIDLDTLDVYLNEWGDGVIVWVRPAEHNQELPRLDTTEEQFIKRKARSKIAIEEILEKLDEITTDLGYTMSYLDGDDETYKMLDEDHQTLVDALNQLTMTYSLMYKKD